MTALGRLGMSSASPQGPRPARGLRRLAAPVALAALVVILVAGCSVPSNTPGDYDDTTKAQFIEGCTATDNQGNSIGNGSTPAYCECAYNWISSNYPYSQDTAQPGYSGITFSDLNNSLRNDPGAMPAELTDQLADNCDQSGSTGVSPATTVPGATGDASTTTTAAPPS